MAIPKQNAVPQPYDPRTSIRFQWPTIQLLGTIAAGIYKLSEQHEHALTISNTGIGVLFLNRRSLALLGGYMNNLKTGLVHSAVCTIIFAVVFGTIVNCGGGGGSGTGGSSAGPSVLLRLATRVNPGMLVAPPSQSSAPVLAAMFQSSPGSSQLQQSFQGDSAPANLLQVLGFSSNSGLIAVGSNESHPLGVFANIGDSVDEAGKTWPIMGFPIFVNGTVSTLVVSGFTNSNVRIRCSDLNSTSMVTDGQLVEPWLDIASGAVTLAVGASRLPLTCSVNTPASNIHYLTFGSLRRSYFQYN